MRETYSKHLRVDTFELAPEIWEIRVDGSVQFENSSILDEAIEKTFRQGLVNLVMNLERAEYIASSGYGCFLNALSRVMERRGKLIFASTPKSVREVLCNLLGYSKILQFEKDVEAALAQFR